MIEEFRVITPYEFTELKTGMKFKPILNYADYQKLVNTPIQRKEVGFIDEDGVRFRCIIHTIKSKGEPRIEKFKCKDCKAFEGYVDYKFYGFCEEKGSTVKENSKPCNLFQRKNKIINEDENVEALQEMQS